MITETIVSYEQELRQRLGIEIPEGDRRIKWSAQDSVNVMTLRKRGLPIRTIADVLRCSTRMVQDVLKGKALDLDR